MYAPASNCVADAELPAKYSSLIVAFGKDIPLHLMEVKAYKNGMTELRYEVKK